MTSRVAYKLAERLDISLNQASRVEAAVGSVIAELLNDNGKTRLPYLGYIKRVERAPRTGYNPSANETIAIKGRYAYQIKPTGNSLLTVDLPEKPD